MTASDARIERELMETLNRLQKDEKIDVLLFAGSDNKKVQALRTSLKKDSRLDFNFLQLANCFAVSAPKHVILELAGRDEVVRIAANPGFTIY